MFVSPEDMIAVPYLTSSDVSEIVSHWLNGKNRCLTYTQNETLIEAVEGCPLPLFLKLSFDEASRWQSYADESTTVLQTTIASSINTLFKRLEEAHGKVLVSHALGYLTAGILLVNDCFMMRHLM